MIEDNAGDARLIQEMLTTQKGIGQIERVDRLSKGIDHLGAHTIDVILLDLGLPDSQGLNTFEKIHAATKQVPILILTGFNNDATS